MQAAHAVVAEDDQLLVFGQGLGSFRDLSHRDVQRALDPANGQFAIFANIEQDDIVFVFM